MTSKSDLTRSAILAAGVQCARDGLHLVTARRVAARAGVHHSNVTYYFKGNAGLLDAVAAEAVTRGDVVVIARLIIEKHPAVQDIPGVEREHYMLAASKPA